MPEPRLEDLHAAFGDALCDLARTDPSVYLVDVDPSPRTHDGRFSHEFPDRWTPGSPDESVPVARTAELLDRDQRVYLVAPTAFASSAAYSWVRSNAGARRRRLTFVALGTSEISGTTLDPIPQVVEDLAVMRTLPGMTVVVPGAAETVRSSVPTLATAEGPTYLRLTDRRLPSSGPRPFALGKWPTLRDGSDLTIVALGAMVPPALEAADALHRVGIESRVLDAASVKPFDASAIVRAARETGAFLTWEEHSVLTGVGAIVATVTAESYPVPVRRLGIPDLFPVGSQEPDELERYGLSVPRALEEAWELLRARGKVH